MTQNHRSIAPCPVPSMTKATRLRRAALLALVLTMPHAVAQAQMSPAVPADGFWGVNGRAVSGTRCGDWFVRLAVEQGRLTGLVGVGQGNVPLENLVLRPDGSFTGNTRAGYVNNRSVRAYDVVGQFSGDIVRLTLKNEICPDRSGIARRQPTGY